MNSTTSSNKSSESLDNETSEDTSDGNVGKRPYSPPRILSSEPLETTAFLCNTAPFGKGNPGFPDFCDNPSS